MPKIQSIKIKPKRNFKASNIVRNIDYSGYLEAQKIVKAMQERREKDNYEDLRGSLSIFYEAAKKPHKGLISTEYYAAKNLASKLGCKKEQRKFGKLYRRAKEYEHGSETAESIVEFLTGYSL